MLDQGSFPGMGKACCWLGTHILWRDQISRSLMWPVTPTYHCFYSPCTRCYSCLRHCTTSRKFAGSIPLWCHSYNLSGRPVSLGSTQGVWLKGAGARADTIHVPFVLKYGILNLLEPPGPAQACTKITFTGTLTFNTQAYFISCMLSSSRFVKSTFA